MKTIVYAMADDPIYRQIEPIILRGIEIATKGILNKLQIMFALQTYIRKYNEPLMCFNKATEIIQIILGMGIKTALIAFEVGVSEGTIPVAQGL